MKRLSQVNRDSANPCKKRIDHWNTIISINWSFEHSEQNFNDYIKPWYVNIDYFAEYTANMREIRLFALRKSLYRACLPFIYLRLNLSH
jgi:hypothetical protein